MDKKEKREYLKPYRCIGGFMLFAGVFTGIYNLAVTGIELLIMLLIDNETVATLLSNGVGVATLLYVYYIGYRIFFKKWLHKLAWFNGIEVRKWGWVVLDILVVFSLIRLVWAGWFGLWYSAGTVSRFQFSDLLIIIYSVVVAPVVEEVIFRGWILKTGEKYGMVKMVLISSLAFGLFHGTFSQALPAFVIGIMFGIMTLKYHSIIPGIIVHMLNNLLSNIAEYVSFRAIEPVFYIIYAVVGFTGIVMFMVKHRKKLKHYLKESFKTIRFSLYSLSFIFFIVIEIVLIIIDFLI